MISQLTLIASGGLLPIIASAHVHTAKMKADQILYVKTALGIATIIETPDAIQSAIIGDQSGFKIEYLDHAVTIKPLRGNAKSNLYLQTASRRYDLRLETSRQDTADYIIYLKEAVSIEPSTWKNVAQSADGKKFQLTCRRIAHLAQGSLLLDFQLSSRQKAKLSPEDIWLTQGKDSKVINGLYISKLEVAKGHPVMIGITIAKSDLNQGAPAEISFKHPDETLRVVLTTDMLWK